jgi:chemotaxis protein MotB
MGNVDDNWGMPDNPNTLRPRRKPPVLPALAFISTVAAVGAAAYAFKVHAAREAARAQVTKLSTENKSLTDAVEQEKGAADRCTTELTTTKASFDEANKAKGELDVELAACNSSKANLETEAAEQKRLLGELKSVTAQFQKMIDSGKLEVVFRHGQMIVKLPAAILFDSGSAKLSKDGVAALGEVAAILRTMRGRHFTVAGHTDNVPLAPGDEFSSNWELSASRAVTVTELLISKGVPAENLVAAGYGPYDPIASNGSAAGRQKNRRIEIILEPNLKNVPAVDAATGKPAPKPGAAVTAKKRK